MEAQGWTEAEHCFRAILDATPGNPSALNNLAIALHEQGRLSEAREILEQVIATTQDFSVAHFNLGRVHMELNDPDTALMCFENVLRCDPADADTFAMIGATLERVGEFGKAEEYFVEAAQFSPAYTVTRMLRFSREFLRKLDVIENQVPLQRPIVRPETSQVAERVVLVSCDPNYLRKYGPAFARSYALSSGSADLLHLHLLDPDERLVEDTQVLLTRAGIRQYCITAERDVQFLAGSLEKRTWFTCARFRHMDAWLDDYAAPIVLLDIDSALQAPAATLIHATGSADLGLFLRRPRRAPWLDLVANTLVARPTVPAKRYLRLVRNYIDFFLEMDKPGWHLDQCALYCTLRMLEAYGGEPAVAWITDAVQASVYHVGNIHDKRMADPRYARFSREE